jgi:hypothetical protein
MQDIQALTRIEDGAQFIETIGLKPAMITAEAEDFQRIDLTQMRSHFWANQIPPPGTHNITQDQDDDDPISDTPQIMGMPSNKNEMVPNADSNSKPNWPYVRTFDTPHQARMVHEQLHMFSQSQTDAPTATAHSAQKPSHNTTSHAPWQQAHAM